MADYMAELADQAIEAGLEEAKLQHELEQRKTVLLKAALDILKKCDDSEYIVDVLQITATWDNIEGDGYCLMEEIENLLEYEV